MCVHITSADMRQVTAACWQWHQSQCLTASIPCCSLSMSIWRGTRSIKMSQISRRMAFVVSSTKMAKKKVQMGSASSHLGSPCKTHPLTARRVAALQSLGNDLTAGYIKLVPTSIQAMSVCLAPASHMLCIDHCTCSSILLCVMSWTMLSAAQVNLQIMLCSI